MSYYFFTHQSDPSERYLAVESGQYVNVSWDETMGHRGRNSSGSNRYEAHIAANYLASGTWVLAFPANLCEETPLPGEDTSLFADLVPPGSEVETGCSGGLGIMRPLLETRKLGKIRVELVDDGFTLALREVAKVMTWAQTAKGYKDHDWLNLPAAEIQLAAAASRHRTDHIEQRLIQGLPALECVDPESALMHKAHEAFGVLAQLEYMLRNKPE